MKILYVNPNINHHKLPFFFELQKEFGRNNVTYATPILEEKWRTNMGFSAIKDNNVFFHINKDSFQEFEHMFDTYDVVLCSIRDYHKLMKRRLKKEKLTFYFSERWFKCPIGKLRLLYPPILHKTILFKHLFNYDNFYYLAQGRTAAEDFFSLGIAKNKTLSFGYFPPIDNELNFEREIVLPADKINLLWCGRMIRQKRVDMFAKAFVELSKKHHNIHLTIVGNGPQRNKVEKIISKGCENRYYTIFDFLPNNVIRDLMKQTDIYVLPSSGWEGWGAVVNEAMSESCAVVAADQIGSVKSIFNEKIGVKFESESIMSLIKALDGLISNPGLLQKQKEENSKYIRTIWSPAEAAKRFHSVVDSLIVNKDLNIYKDGPMSLIF